MFRTQSLALFFLLAPAACFAAGGGEGVGKVIQILQRVVGGVGDGSPVQEASAECVLISMATPESKAALTLGRRMRDSILREMEILGIDRIFTKEQIEFAADQKMRSGVSEAERAAVVSAKDHLLLVFQREPEAFGSLLGTLLREHVSFKYIASNEGFINYLRILRDLMRGPLEELRNTLLHQRSEILRYLMTDQNGNLHLGSEAFLILLRGVCLPEFEIFSINKDGLVDALYLQGLGQHRLERWSAEVILLHSMFMQLQEYGVTQLSEDSLLGRGRSVAEYISRLAEQRWLFQLELDRRGLK